MRVGLITIGKELLDGRIRNTNSEFIMSHLNTLGYETSLHMTVNDDYNQIEDLLTYLDPKLDLFILTGGLGSTNDDITQPVVEKHLEDKDYSLDLLENKYGIAQGRIYQAEDKKYLLLPGPPRELEPMFIDFIYRELENKNDLVVKNKIYRISFLTEGQTFRLIEEAGFDTLREVTTYIDNENSVYIQLNLKGHREVEEKFKLLDRKIKDIFGLLIYSNSHQKREEILVERLREKNLKLATAESFTGGNIASSLIKIPDASQIIDQAFVSYANEAKEELLGVDKKRIDSYGVVSSEICQDMLEGLYKRTGADLCLATTGYAGPKGDQVGLAYIGIRYRGKNHVFKHNFIGSRDIIIEKGKNAAIDYSLLALEDKLKDLSWPML